ncbi:alpha-endosulfine isoform X2 [Poecile atricapillus]|uniref:alpha-endosulfine isoform X2 n=1 Tax=Poecile atricapillus TaxID=48891 RepID=UPI0027384BCC|nr:alpha-endosulfine isoform X2 [Poecile atricapillus]
MIWKSSPGSPNPNWNLPRRPQILPGTPQNPPAELSNSTRTPKYPPRMIWEGKSGIHGLDTQEKDKAIPPERAEEAKLKAKYPTLGQKPGGSDFLMKRLQKGQKYFDSGDYNMAKAKMKNKQLPSAGPDKNLVTGDHIPTPQDLPQRKSSLVTSKLAG